MRFIFHFRSFNIKIKFFYFNFKKNDFFLQSKNKFSPINDVLTLLVTFFIFVTVAQTSIKDIVPVSKTEFEKFVHPNIKKLLEKYNLEVDDVRRLYFNDDDITEENIENLVNFFGDMHFVEGTDKVLKIQLEKSGSSTFLYQYSFDKVLSTFKKMAQTNLKGKNSLCIIELHHS